MIYKVTDIQYDTDGEDVTLPTEMNVTVPDEIENSYEIEEYISDRISEFTGFCHKGFSTTPEIE
jgi:hypothetical protein